LLPDDVSMQLLRLYAAFAHGRLSPLLPDSVVWELCGDLSNCTAVVERRHPRWMRQCLDLVEAECTSAITVTDIAARLGVHPVHWSREFRRRFGQTLGEYVHKMRVRLACAMMKANEGQPLAHVAASTGFADQSHFCRVFKSLVGCVPSRFPARRRSAGHPDPAWAAQ
jgi:AraC family transcriptional regulator